MYRNWIYLACLLALLGLLEASATHAADESLVGWWKLDETSGTVAHDSSGYGNHGTLHGDPQWTGHGLEFDGDGDYVDCGDGPSLNIAGSVTVMGWIRLDGPADDRKIAGNQDGITGGYKFGVYGNRVEFEIRTADNVAVLNRSVADGIVLDPGTYHHVAGVYSEGDSIRTYVDGVLDRELSTTELLGTSTGTFKLGREPFSDSYYWLGLMEDVRVYNRALTSGEIQALMAPTQAQNPNPPDGARDVLEPLLTWESEGDVVCYDVYLGTSPILTEADLVAACMPAPTYFHPRGLEPGVTYYWRIDAVLADGTVVRGDLWHFTVGPGAEPIPVAWWRFDEGEGSVASDSVGTAHAPVEGATWTAGHTGSALHFDGVNDVVTTPLNIDQTEHSSGATFSAWVYPDSLEHDEHASWWGLRHIIGSDDGGHDWGILCNSDGHWMAFTGEGGRDTGLMVDLNRWQFVTGVFEPGAGVRFYKNDQEVFIPHIGYDTSTNSLAIGDNPGPWPSFFAGKIDEVRIFDRALSPDEVNNLFGRTEGYVDLDIDSNNDNMFDLPDRSHNEDAMEDDPGQSGRIVMNNNDDNDGDQIPDFADGFNLDGLWGNEDDLCASEQFVPLALEMAHHVELERARVRVAYEESIPADTAIIAGAPNEYVPAPGALRIWAKPGHVQRNAAPVGRGGDFVIPSEYSSAQLGFAGDNRTLTWYVEGVETSWALADREIVVEVDPDGPGPAEYAGDLVRLTVIDLQLVTQGPDGEMVDQEFFYNCVPTPQIRATVEDCEIDASGLATVTVNGTVTDQTSGIVDDPRSQVRSLTVSAGNQPGNTVDLVNSAVPEYPWQPYRFQSSFSTTVQFQTDPSEEEYYVFLETSENAAGVAAQVALLVFYNGLDVSLVEEANNGPGTYIPTIMRVDAPEGTFTEGKDTLHAFDSEWPLEYGDFGDGQYYYAMGSQEDVQIFLPALYAGDSSAFIGPVDKLVALVNKDGKKVSFREAAKIHGLMVDNDSVKSILDLSLTNFVEETYKWGNVTKYVYRPRTGWATNKNNSLDTEIKFRYVNHGDTISGSFKSKAQFEAHVRARKYTVEAARSVHHWTKYWKANPPYWTATGTILSGTACAAIADAFTNQKKYGMGCWRAAVLVMERGMCLENSAGVSAAIGSVPFDPYDKVIIREGLPAKPASVLLKDKVKWIPGDWGYILNPDPAAWQVKCPSGHTWTILYGASETCSTCGLTGQLQGFEQGENIIYLGGPFQGQGKPAIGNFELHNETTFKKTAWFWGHITPREMTLQDWYDEVNKWSSKTAQILDIRDRFKY